MKNETKTIFVRLNDKKDKDIIDALNNVECTSKFVKSALKNKIEKNSEFEKNFIKFYGSRTIRICIGQNIIYLDPTNNEDKFLFFENEKQFDDFCIFNKQLEVTRELILAGDDLSIVYEVNLSGAYRTLKLGSCTLVFYKIDNLFAFVKID